MSYIPLCVCSAPSSYPLPPIGVCIILFGYNLDMLQCLSFWKYSVQWSHA